MCKECANGFELKNGVCSDIKLLKTEPESHIRWVTYAGLFVATCIILRNNVYIASLVGFMVAIYIGVAEYTFPNTPLLSPVQQAVDKLRQELSSKFIN